ncbi:hypothetical protein Tco_0997415 [Tanacetum coccineum]
MGSRDSLETVSARGTKQRDLCQRYEKYIKIWGARHEESWLMDTNDSSFTLPAIRDQIVLDQEEEPIADEMTDSEHAEEEPNKGMKQSVAWAPNRDMNTELKFKLDCMVGGLDKSPFGFSKL